VFHAFYRVSLDDIQRAMNLAQDRFVDILNARRAAVARPEQQQQQRRIDALCIKGASVQTIQETATQLHVQLTESLAAYTREREELLRRRDAAFQNMGEVWWRQNPNQSEATRRRLEIEGKMVSIEHLLEQVDGCDDELAALS